MTEKTANKPKTVYQAIVACSAEIAEIGISKDRKNTQQGYKFRGIDDVYNAMAPILSKHSLCVLPRVLSREVVERVTKQGGALFYTTVEVEFDFVSAEDGSKHTVKTYGEAMDSGDKSTNKAMSAAYKYACMQAFCIPTEGDNDADSTTHEVKAKDEKPQPTPEQAFVQEWLGMRKRELAGLLDVQLFNKWNFEFNVYGAIENKKIHHDGKEYAMSDKQAAWLKELLDNKLASYKNEEQNG